MCNIDHDPNKGKEKVNDDSVANLKTMDIPKNEKKRKAIMLGESGVETRNSKSPNNGDASEEESSKEISPFLLLGFIIDPTKRSQRAYSCNFCRQKFLTPQALGGHQNGHRLERRIKHKIQAMNTYWTNYLIGNQGVVSPNTMTLYNGGYGYQYNGFDNMNQLASSSNFNSRNLLGPWQHIPQINKVINEVDRTIVSPQVTMPQIECGSISNKGDDVVHEDKETRDDKAIQDEDDLILKL